MSKKSNEELEESKVTQILLAGLLLQGEPKPDLHQLEELMKLRHGTLSKIFPQRQSSRRKTSKRAKPMKEVSENAEES